MFCASILQKGDTLTANTKRFHVLKYILDEALYN